MEATSTVIAIANHLGVSPNQIKKVTELAQVWCVVVQGRRPRFVSKRKVNQQMEINAKIPKTLEEARSLSGIRFHAWDEECRQVVQALLDRGRVEDYPLYPAHPQYKLVRDLADKKDECRLNNVIPAIVLQLQ
ncbi:MAG: hypothetical protein AB1861_03390 [Cyanobacteriota bacterium]